MLFFQPSKPPTVPPPFLRLPIELRRQIYHYLLPSTSHSDSNLQCDTVKPEKSGYKLPYVHQLLGPPTWKLQTRSPKTDREGSNDVVWRRGSIALLGVNHQIHNECVDMIYGENVFVIDVNFDGIRFRYKWLLPSNLTPNRTYSFLDHFSQRNLCRIRNCVVNVEHVDDYTGMIKFNCGGRGLTAGIRRQVENLVEQLSLAPSLHKLHIHLIDKGISRQRLPSGRVHRVQDERNFAASQTVLDPFYKLHEVRNAKVTGVSTEYSESLERRMTAAR
ncbi:hypothetical protein GQ43DRAFT_120526 [Delitschia confertaspora ATCC 74209]|uniref:DUF7730 domain-containing protein n=1 Tax=Delitschia confertaspora ATCC 74209 TaxID=1513339 RepID=A0A9P4JH44_9PLEO|nr:hypothetical protein GQ43DRAFT_120526 [Delitschia confertaspora ATCC 74209]